jgi:hypothetical protein
VRFVQVRKLVVKLDAVTGQLQTDFGVDGCIVAEPLDFIQVRLLVQFGLSQRY